MKTSTVIKHPRFGSIAVLARQLHCSTQNVYKWNGDVPWLRQFQIEVLTNGELKARRSPPPNKGA